MLSKKTIIHTLFLLLCIIGNTHAAIQEISSANLFGRSLLAINQPGQYLITEDIDFAEKPIVISANNVELDLGGNTITFSNLNPFGILFATGNSNITIKNGSILNSSPEAFNISSNNNISLINLNITVASTTGIVLTNSKNIRITSVTLTGTPLIGISITTSVDVEVTTCTLKSIITKSFTGVHILNSETITCNSNIMNNIQTKKNFYGFKVISSSRIIISQNTVSMNTAGRSCTCISMIAGRHNTVSQNNIFMNSTNFLEFTSPNTKAIDNKKKFNRFIGIDIDKGEHLCIVSGNTIRDNRARYAAYGVRIQERTTEYRHIHLEKNDISTNHAQNIQFGIYDADNLSQNVYLQNKVSFHGQSLNGSSMPTIPTPKANYFMLKNCPIHNLIKEASADELSFLPEDLNNKNLSIYGYFAAFGVDAGIFHD